MNDLCHQSLTLDNEFIPAILTMAGLHRSESEFEKAAIQIAKAGELDDGTEIAYLNYLSAAQALKSHKPSEVAPFANLALTSRATYLPVSDLKIWELRMLAGVAAKDGKEVTFAAEKVLALTPDDERALFSLWKAYRFDGRKLAAQGIAEKLYVMAPEDEQYQTCRLISMLDLGQIKAAESIADKLRQLNPDSKLALEVKEKIRVAKSKAGDEPVLKR